MESFAVGIDPSLTNTGIVVLDAATGELVATGNSSEAVKEWEKEPHEWRISPLGQANRLHRIQCYMAGLLFNLKGTLYVAYEDYSFKSENRAFALGELGGVLKTYLAEVAARDMALVAPNSLKSFAVKDGLAGKEPLFHRAVLECPGLGSKPSQDVCDAYFLAMYAWHRWFPEAVIEYSIKRDLLRHRLRTACAQT